MIKKIALGASLLAASCFIGPMPAKSQSYCSAALLLALDVSGSVDWKEYHLQRKGIADAFRDDELIRLIEFLPGGISVAVTQWSGTGHQEQVVNWREIKTKSDAVKFAASVQAITRNGWGPMTATGNALLHADALLRRNPYKCVKNVIDLSSDGRTNRGVPEKIVSQQLATKGHTINVLAIMENDHSLLNYFAKSVIGGPGSFVETARGYADYARAMKRKLLRELSPNVAEAENENEQL